MRVVYADTIFITNLVINYLILLSCAKICAVSVKRIRLALGAAAGGFYAVFAAIPSLEFLHNPLFIIAVGVLIVLISFGGETRLMRIILVFFAASASFAGAALAVSLLGGGLQGGFFTPISFKVLALSFAVCYAVMTVVFRGSGGNKSPVKKLIVRRGSMELALHALVDTGNTLKDPITGRGIIITSAAEGKKLLPRKIRTFIAELSKKDAVSVLENLELQSENVRFQLIPYSAVGVTGGLLLAFRADEVLCDGEKKTGVLVALSPNEVSDNGTYSALIGA